MTLFYLQKIRCQQKVKKLTPAPNYTYNYEQDYYEMLKKLKQCKKWGVQIADCRYRPLNQTFDNYNPRKRQTNDEYYIYSKWTDKQIKLFRKKVRQQNIMVRHGFDFYSKELERLGAKRRKGKLLEKETEATAFSYDIDKHVRFSN